MTTWTCVTFETEARFATALSDGLLAHGASSVDASDAWAGTEREQPLYQEPGAPGADVWPRLRLAALFEAGVDIDAALAAACESAGLDRAPPYACADVEEQDWVALTRGQFQPIRITDRLYVVPTWCEPPQPDAVNLTLDPGTAFGTGSHPTTQLCLRWLAGNLQHGATLLDYGCGSGILAIAAMKLGAARACGVDIDAQAVQVSQRNAAQNAVACEFLTPDQDSGGEADVVVANILANPLVALAPLLRRRVRRRGHLVLSGILTGQWRDVARAYRDWFSLAPAEELEGWVCLAGVRQD